MTTKYETLSRTKCDKALYTVRSNMINDLSETLYGSRTQLDCFSRNVFSKSDRLFMNESLSQSYLYLLMCVVQVTFTMFFSSRLACSIDHEKSIFSRDEQQKILARCKNARPPALTEN